MGTVFVMTKLNSKMLHRLALERLFLMCMNAWNVRWYLVYRCHCRNRGKGQRLLQEFLKEQYFRKKYIFLGISRIIFSFRKDKEQTITKNAARKLW